MFECTVQRHLAGSGAGRYGESREKIKRPAASFIHVAYTNGERMDEKSEKQCRLGTEARKNKAL